MSKLEHSRWVEIGVFGEGNAIRPEPFAEIELSHVGLVACGVGGMTRAVACQRVPD